MGQKDGKQTTFSIFFQIHETIRAFEVMQEP